MFLHSLQIPDMSISCFVNVNPVFVSIYWLKILKGQFISIVFLQRLQLNLWTWDVIEILYQFILLLLITLSKIFLEENI